MATSQEREDLFLGKGIFKGIPFYKVVNRTTGVSRVNDLLKDKSLLDAMNPHNISIYNSIFECTDIDLLVKLHDEIVKRPEDEVLHNLLSSVLHTYIYMLCIIDEFGINDAIANRSKYETPKGKITWNKVKDAIAEMKKRNSTSSGTTGVSSAPITVKKSVTPPVIHLSYKAIECKKLLEANHNIILSGAPGTGKTYMAKQIALAMTGSKDRIGFVQFHPSYDYTDFVEGLRPTSTSCSTIGFERKDGIFKEFCAKALTDTVPIHHLSPATSVSPSIATIYGSLVTGIRSGAITSLPLRTGVSMDASVSPQDNIILSTHGGGNSYTVSLDDIMELSKTYLDKDSLDNMKNIDTEIRAVLGGRHSSSIWAVLYEIYKRLESASSIIINNKGTVAEDKAKHVFIIDEINRGEMSKVFGELFFSIDPGYRGESGAVRTQYANMVTTPNAFDKVLRKSDPKDCGHFFVPENVYIIGTMNDIDRSVDSMDFAMRRRFLIKDIKAEDTQEDMLKLETIKDIYPSITAIEPKVVDKMNALNKVIEGKSIKAKLGSSYSLGASYFQKYYKYNDFKLLWEYHLEGILREYLRGTQDPEGDLKILKEVYDNA